MGLFSSILGAVAGPIIGGIFGKKSPQQTTTRVNYAQMVADSQAAGFNPLTALRNGGAAGNSTTTTTPAFSSASLIADAVSKGFNAYTNHKSDLRDAQREKIELEIQKEQLSQLKKNSGTVRLPNYGFAVPTVTQYSGEHESTPSSTRNIRPALSSGDDNSLLIGGAKISRHEGFSDAEKYEERYGDLLGSVIGVPIAGADAWKTVEPHLQRGVDHLQKHYPIGVPDRLNKIRKSKSRLSKPKRKPRTTRGTRLYSPPPTYLAPVLRRQVHHRRGPF